MASKFKLEIVTPDRRFFEDDVDMVIVRGVDGDLGILANHSPYVTPLDIGKIKIKNDGNYRVAAICSGYIEVTKEKTTIVTDSAEWPEEIDINRANEAKNRAEERLKKKESDIDVVRAETALRKALNRLEVSKESNK